MVTLYNILHGNASDVLEELVKDHKEKNKYRLIVTSPPYYKHRNYGQKIDEIGQEKSVEEYLDNLVDVFGKCKELLTDDGSLFVVIGDTRRNHSKLMIPHRLAIKLTEIGYTFQEDIIWYKKNAISTSSKTSLTQAYELVLFLSKGKNPYLNMDPIRVQGNEVTSGSKETPLHQMQFNPKGKNPGNVWEISTKAHHGNEHFAIFPEDLIAKIVKFTTEKGDYTLDPFVGRGTAGIVSACLKRKFTGIDLYSANVVKTKRNVQNAIDEKIPQKVLNQIITTKSNLREFF